MTLRVRVLSALLLPPIAWYVFQQGMAHMVHVRCGAAPVAGAIWGAASLAACALAAVLAGRRSRQSPISAYLWLCRVALLGAGVFALAIAFQTLAVLMVPTCAR